MDEILDNAFKESPEFGVRVLHDSYRRVVISCIKSHGMGLNHDDVDEVYSQTMLELFRKAQKETFDRSKAMKMALHIAKQRTRDCCRQRRMRAIHEGTEYQDHAMADLNGTTVGLKAKFDIVDYHEFDAALWECIEKLPPMQKLAAECFNRGVYEVGIDQRYAALAEAMSEILGRPVTHVAAKNAWYEAQDKITEAVKRKGFDI